MTSLTFEHDRAPQRPPEPDRGPAGSYEIPWHEHDDGSLASILSLIAGHRPLVDPADVQHLAEAAADTTARGPVVLQVGDCVEGFDDASALHTRRKAAFLARLGDRLARTGRPVLTVGRMGGQFAKPRSAPYETSAEGIRLTYRGPIVHAWNDRRVNAHRMSTAALASAQVAGTLDELARDRPTGGRVWTSHEVLLTEYEDRWVRDTPRGRYLTHTHWPWIGNRTRTLDGRHVSLLADVRNPVSVKVDASLTADDAVDLLAILRSQYHDRHVSFIARFGVEAVDHLLPLARALAERGDPPRWLIDPLHGNTVSTPIGKTRPVDAVVEETRRAAEHLLAAGFVPGGLHLEATDLRVDECVVDRTVLADIEATPAGSGIVRGLSLCDPRLNEAQAGQVIDAFVEAVS